eukprot:15481765-Alexandrium_andersonii.AAC.1
MPHPGVQPASLARSRGRALHRRTLHAQPPATVCERGSAKRMPYPGVQPPASLARSLTVAAEVDVSHGRHPLGGRRIR